jgi:hypothetical protein
MGPPHETSLRVCLLATRLAQRISLFEREVGDIYLTGLLRFVAARRTLTKRCSSLAVTTSPSDAPVLTDIADPRQVLAFLASGLPNETPALSRGSAVIGRLARMATYAGDLKTSHGEVATSIAQHLGLPLPFQQPPGQTFERWDAKGGPRKLKGERLARHSARPAVLTRASRNGVNSRSRAVCNARSWRHSSLPTRLKGARERRT